MNQLTSMNNNKKMSNKAKAKMTMNYPLSLLMMEFMLKNMMGKMNQLKIKKGKKWVLLKNNKHFFNNNKWKNNSMVNNLVPWEVLEVNHSIMDIFLPLLTWKVIYKMFK